VPAVLAAKQQTAVIPIVFASANDPVGNSLVKSLPRPGGNATGLSSQSADVAGKRLALLREIVPGVHRLAIMFHVDSPNAVREMREAEAVARAVNIEVVTIDVRRADDIAPAIEALKGRADALYVVIAPLITSNRSHISTFALTSGLPTLFSAREFVAAGGLMSYGPSYLDLYRRAADYVDKILRGAKPVDLPVEQPTKFDLIVNLITARALGLTVPSTLLARADEVIE
jgi:putative ABC transport system substrate-binding protein